jgi:hypothetical protein
MRARMYATTVSVLFSQLNQLDVSDLIRSRPACTWASRTATNEIRAETGL